VRIELVGLGEVGRPWEMAVAPLPDGSRLVRLADQSQTRAAEQMRVDFVANASHELRTPLATLLGFIETLQEEEAVDPETRQRFVGIMFGEATRMRDLLEDLMSLSRIEAERFALPRDTVDLLPLIDEVTGALKPLAQGRALRVGSSTVYPFTKAVAEEFMRANPGISVIVESTGTGAGMKLFCAGVGASFPTSRTPRARSRRANMTTAPRTASRRHRSADRHRRPDLIESNRARR
jgi:signal transduction histidine kinase